MDLLQPLVRNLPLSADRPDGGAKNGYHKNNAAPYGTAFVFKNQR